MVITDLLLCSSTMKKTAISEAERKKICSLVEKLKLSIKYLKRGSNG